MNLKNTINNLNNIIIKHEQTIQELKSKLYNINNNFILSLQNFMNNLQYNNNYNFIQSLQNFIMELQNQNYNNSVNKTLFTRSQIMSVNFISTDQSLHYSVPCVGNDIFAVIEEKLYQQFPKYRETNNNFLANGKPVLRFKTIEQNNIGNGFPVILNNDL